MKVILVGYGEMLRALAFGVLNSKHEIVGILRQETIKRNKIIRFFYDYLKPSEDYLFIKSHRLREIDVKSVNSDKFRNIVKDSKADVVIVGSWSERFSAQTLSTIPNGFINVHPSLLPKYRGPNPYLQVIWHNETKSGITFHIMDVNYDTGSILHQKEVPVLPNDTGGSLRIRCCNTARFEVKFLLDNLKERILNQRSQIETNATYYPQISIQEAVLNFQKETSSELDRRIRAFSPWLHCYLQIKGNFFYFEEHKITNEKIKQSAGTIADKTKNDIFVVCKDFKVMKFSRLKILNPPFYLPFSNFFWNNININDKVN